MKNIKIHPIFLFVGCVFIVTGKGLPLIIYLIFLLFHEWVHFETAKVLGTCLFGCEVTAFGCRIEGSLIDTSPINEIVIAMLAPFINLFIGAMVVASWQVFPFLIDYTKTIAVVNFSIFLANILPVYPLDGGRCLFVLLKCKFSVKTSEIIMVVLGVLASISFAFMFVLSVVYGRVNFSFLTFSLFIFIFSIRDLRRDVLLKKVRNSLIMPTKNQVRIVEIQEDTKLFEMIKEIKSQYVTYFVLKNKGFSDFSFSERQLIPCIQEKNFHITAADIRKSLKTFTK